MNFRVFVIDDEESIRETFDWYLSSKGHEVITLPNPSFCALYLGENCDIEDPCADFLIIDYSMPRMNGIEFLELLEKHNCLHSARVKLILTGNANMVDKETAKRLGCEVRQKPMTVIEVEEWINAWAETIPEGRKLADLSRFRFT